MRRRSGKAGNKLLVEEDGGRRETSDGIDTHLAATVLELYTARRFKADAKHCQALLHFYRYAMSFLQANEFLMS